jgi:PKHD-type hydroxylase
MNNKTLTWHLTGKRNDFWACLDNVFTPEECQIIIDQGIKSELEQAKIGGGGTDVSKGGLTNVEIRKNKLSYFNSSDPEYSWIFQRITDAIVNLNSQVFHYNLEYIELLQFTAYDQLDDHYDAHMDVIMPICVHNRKLSFSLQLSDSDDYEGCDLEIYQNGSYQPTVRKKGSIIFFPSFILHKVSPLTQGVRYSLVGWACGPEFR